MKIKRRTIGKGRSTRASSLVEAIVGFIVIIPIGLAAVDVATLISTSQTNEQVAEQAARAAACQRSDKGAQKAAEESAQQTPTSNIITNIAVDPVKYDPVKGEVTVSTSMQVKMPIPLPYLNQFDLHASAMQPIVAFPASI